MKPQIIYKLGNKLRIDLHTEPEPSFHIVVAEKNAAVLTPGKFYDFIRILNSITARQGAALASIGGAPVSVTGERVLIGGSTKQQVTDPRQHSLFPDRDTEEDKENTEETKGEVDEGLEQYLRKRLLRLKLQLGTEPTEELMSEIAYVKKLLKADEKTD